MGSNEVATIDKLKSWDYLDEMKLEVNDNGNIEVTLLIGANRVKVLEPRKLIASNNGVHMHSEHSWDGALYDSCTLKINLRN